MFLLWAYCDCSIFRSVYCLGKGIRKYNGNEMEIFYECNVLLLRVYTTLQVMNVMGLRYLIHCTSWFVVTFIEMLIIIISIFIIIKAGGILPISSGSLLFLYLLDFGFSVIMFW